MGRSINIVYFAWVRERLGLDNESVLLDEKVRTIADVLTLLNKRGVAYSEILSDVTKLRFALDQDFGTPASLVGSAKELAIFPPVTGG
jgi:molybdopterin synthase sulfur carrier subunit